MKEEIHPAFSEIITQNKVLKKILLQLTKFAKTDATILLLGETGTGKDILSYCIHKASHRCNFPYVSINCSAIPENLLESELFGYKKGAFTDAKQDKIGKIEAAHKGTIFLDEIGEMPLSSQAKLLKVVENKLLEKLGATTPVPVDVRIIAATNSDLEEKVRKGKFRDDLYYRLQEVKFQIPPLRERSEDIPLLIDFFIKTFNREFQKNVKGVSDTVLSLLKVIDFPGNVRELKSLIKRAVILADGSKIRLEHLPLDIRIKPEKNGENNISLTLKEWIKKQPIGIPIGESGNFSNGLLYSNQEDNLPLTLKEVEKMHIKKIMKMCDNNKVKAAKILGINRTTLYQKIKEYRI